MTDRVRPDAGWLDTATSLTDHVMARGTVAGQGRRWGYRPVCVHAVPAGEPAEFSGYCYRADGLLALHSDALLRGTLGRGRLPDNPFE